MRYLLIILCLLNLSCTHSEKTPYTEQVENWYNEGPKRVNLSEVKALWIVRDSIKTKKDIDSVINLMKEYSLNTALVQVRGLGDVLYKSKIEPMADGIEPGLDPLQYFVEEATRNGIEVQAWINVLMISKPDFLEKFSKKSEHVTTKQASWVLKDADNKSMMEYKTEQLSSDWMDGAYLDPSNPKVKAHILKIVKEIIEGYAIDGIHLDFIRYPYDKDGEKLFGLDDRFVRQAEGLTGLTSSTEYKKYPQYLESLNSWRLNQVNSIVESIHKSIKKKSSQMKLSAAVWANKKKIYANVFQDWPLWLDKAWIDQAYMMIYVDDEDVHDLRMEEFYNTSFNHKLVIGVGLHREPSVSVIEHQVESGRAVGALGFSLFSAESLRVNKDRFRYRNLKEVLAPPEKF